VVCCTVSSLRVNRKRWFCGFAFTVRPPSTPRRAAISEAHAGQNHNAIALGSAREAFVALRAAEAWRYIDPLSPPHLDAFNRVIGTLVNNVARR
jgi:hypothetical protein